MINKQNRAMVRDRKHVRVRKKVKGTQERPRLNIYRSLNNVYAQIIDDLAGKTLVSASTLDSELKGKLEGTANKAAARAVGKLVGERAKNAGIEKVVFDRGGYIYHGKVKELAEGAREAGLEF